MHLCVRRAGAVTTSPQLNLAAAAMTAEKEKTSVASRLASSTAMTHGWRCAVLWLQWWRRVVAVPCKWCCCVVAVPC
eukprot:366320-Chlamydomonas_euryale.AAC.14